MCDYSNQAAEKATYANVAVQSQSGFTQIRKPSPAEQHAAEERGLLERAAQHAKAAKFFAAHPEFAEFIELRNQGIL